MKITVTVNGQAYERDVPGHRTLLHFLRQDLGLTGSKEGCGAGECGACTVLLDGHAVNACLVLAPEVDGRRVETVEGQAIDGKLSTIQDAFNRNHAVQCGFCTSGMVMSVQDLLVRQPKPTDDDIKEAIEGNFCRCTGYLQIIEAVRDASGRTEGKGGLKHA
jgi:aerobic-type carbon monoxide dehydrogenase small subunit (CoxS/CutS family)